MDKNGYPDKSELKTIREWDWHDFVGLMGYIEDVLKYAGYGYFYRGRKYYRLSTGGWSGNESIIAALQENVMFWNCYWESSKRGGHYVFQVPKALKGK